MLSSPWWDPGSQSVALEVAVITNFTFSCLSSWDRDTKDQNLLYILLKKKGWTPHIGTFYRQTGLIRGKNIVSYIHIRPSQVRMESSRILTLAYITQNPPLPHRKHMLYRDYLTPLQRLFTSVRTWDGRIQADNKRGQFCRFVVLGVGRRKREGKSELGSVSRVRGRSGRSRSSVRDFSKHKKWNDRTQKTSSHCSLSASTTTASPRKREKIENSKLSQKIGNSKWSQNYWPPSKC